MIRRKVLRGAQIIVDSTVIDCVVTDVSATGAQIRLAAPVPVPELFTLRFRDGSACPARRRWARGTLIGLEFIGATAESAGQEDEPARRARAIRRQLQALDPAETVRLLRAAWFFGDDDLRRAAEAAELAHARLDAALRPHTAGRAPFLAEPEA